jgi:class 3 adenylate cyclase/tetratricopeptide (TPR) repeat protein
MLCPNCKTENPAGKKFCGDCGGALAAVCPKCGAGSPPGKRFCGECGTALGATPALQGATAQPPKPADGERRHLTVLFCDLVGSTEIASQLDPEQWHEIASDYQRDAAAAVTRFGGHVAKFLGDGLVVYFGYPRAMEDAAERAVRAGLAIVEATQALNARFASHKLTLKVRVGIHSGSVVVAQGGGRDADMFGDAPNIAARVQTAAAPDSVVITEGTHQLVSGLFVVEDKGAQPLKGIAQPVRLYRVAGTGVSRRRVFAARELTPFVGREDEMQLLARRWERVREGDGQMVLLMGEPGIGKSRLLEEFRAQIRSDAHLWVACACEELFNNTPFHAVVQMLDQSLGWRGDESEEERAAQLERALRGTGARLEEAMPLIAELLGIAHSWPALNYSPEQKRRRLFAALAAWVFGAARIQPLVMAIEDLHWVDPSTLEFLQMLAEQGASAPLLLLCTSRPEFRTPWPMRAHHAQLTLNRLNDKQTREMVTGFVARSGLLTEVVEGVIKRTDGVPLFAEELARLMLDSPAAGQEIPATLQDSLTARLDRLGPAKDVAQIGSVIGREFSYELLEAVAAIDESALHRALMQLADAELILVRGVPPDATYQFKHALTRDAAYDALLKSRRAELHGRIAQTIVDKFPRLAETQPQLLARHWTAAGRSEPAIAAWTLAARAADARNAFREAEEAYGQALALLSTLPDTAERDAREIEVLTPMMVVAAATRSWSSDEVARLSARAEVLAVKGGNLLQLVLQRFAATVGAAGDITRSLTLADQLLDLAGREGSDFALRCAHEGQIAMRYNASDFAAVEEHFRAWLEICERSGYGPFPAETPTTFGSAAMAAWHQGLSDTARDRIDRATAFGRQSSNPVDLTIALERKTTLYVIQRDPQKVEEAANEALALCQAHGLAASIPTFNAKLAWARAHLGDAAASAPVMRENVAAMADGKGYGGHHDSLLRLAHVLRLAGEEDEALATVEIFLGNLPESLNARPNGYHLRGELHRKAGRDDAAEKDFRQSIAIARQIGTKFVELRAATSLARVMQARGETAAARALVEPLYAAFTEGFDTADMKDAKAFLDALG